MTYETNDLSLEDIEEVELAQLRRELQMNELGKKDLARATEAAEDRAYASHTVYGDDIRRKYTLTIAQALKDKFKELKRGKAMEGARALFLLNDVLDWNRVAYITLSTMLDLASSPKKYKRLHSDDKKAKRLVTDTEMFLAVANRILVEANLQHIKKNFRHKYKDIKDEFFTEHASYNQRVTNVKRYLRQYRDYFKKLASGEKERTTLTAKRAAEIADLMQWIDWTNSVKVQVGSHLAKITNEVTGFFERADSFNEKGKKQFIFQFSSRFNAYSAALMSQADDFAWFDLPMLVPPADWTKDKVGGFRYSAGARYKRIVRGYREGTEISQMTLDFINTQQSVGFCLDKDILSIQKFLADKGWSILGEDDKHDESKDSWRPYKAPDDWDVPKLPAHLQGIKMPRPDASQEEKDAYTEKKRVMGQITTWHDRQLKLVELARPVNRYLRLIRFIENDDCFFFPWSLDWRGRCYPMVDAFNPQGPEYQKAVLNFAEDTPVDDRTQFWLCVGIASAAGMDKESFETRVAWTKTNLKKVLQVANDPLGKGFEIWREMPEPWIFLRACLEYKRIFVEGQTYTNIGCLGQDATQSGLQLLGGMVLDHQTCDLVNCVPGHDKPQDAYGTVLAEALKLIEEDPENDFPIQKLRGKRKIVKTPVMTKVYAAGHNTRLGQIRRALQKEGIRLAKNPETNEEMLEYFVRKVEQAMLNTIPGVDLILDWFQTVVATAFERGVEDIVYETPSGNRVVVEYREPLTKTISTESLGSGVCVKDNKPKVRITTDRGSTIQDDVLRAIAANFTHGAGDASLLHIAFHDVKSPVLTTTHDCVYAPPCKVIDENHIRIREAFITICRSGVLQKFAELNRCPEIKPPLVNTYDPETVRQARYFFC
jgi:DNA-directed RNA polymerase